jgi:predicted Fe-Mo cluster-binding NifX family protein
MDDLKMDDIGVQEISAEEQRLIGLKNRLKWFTAIIVVAAIAIAGMLTINYYPDLLRRIFGDQERGDLAAPTATYSSSKNYRNVSGSTSSTVYLGVDIQNITDTMASAMNVKSSGGVVITRVMPSSPADVSGLEAGDLIIRFDRVRVKTTSDIEETLKDEEPGDVIKVVVDRDGMIRTFYLELGSMPASYLQQSAMTVADTTIQPATQWGCTLSTLTPDLITRLSIPDSIKGVVVVEVSATGLAKSSGILVGDVILKVNRRNTETLQDFYLSIENQSLIVIEIYRAGRLTYVQIQSAANAIPPVATIAGTVADTQSPNLPNKVAIAANGNNLNSPLAPYFGSAPFFIIIDINTKQYSVVPNSASTSTIPYGIAAVQLVSSTGANAVIAQNYGPVIYQALMAAQLQLYRANAGNVSDALAQYESYVLTQVSSPTTQGMSRNIVSTGGSPFTSDDTDDDEEQSGYKGMPYTIPPQGKYDPALDPANASPMIQPVSGTSNRIAIAAMTGNINANVAPLFGQAPWFIVYDLATKQYQAIPNPSSNDSRSYGTIATQAIQAQNVGAVVAGNFGSRAYTALIALNIKPYAYQGTVTNAIKAYQAGQLTPVIDTTLPGYNYTQNLVKTGGSPFTTEDEDDDDEEQSGYKGLPYTIPPQGKYDPELDPNNTISTQQNVSSTSLIPQRVAIAATGNTLKSTLASAFRTAQFFLIVDVKSNQFYAIQNLYMLNPVATNTIQPANLVASTGARASIAGAYGLVCYNILTSFNIVPYTANPGSVEDILKLYQSGTLKVYTFMPAAVQMQTQTSQLTAGSTQRTDYCYCPYCRILVPHPSSVPCSALECPQCGNRLMNYDAQTTSVTPQQLPVYSNVVSGVLSAGSTSSILQLPVIDNSTQSQYYQVPIQNQIRSGSYTYPTNTLNLNQQTQYCYCPHCNVVYEHPRGLPCSAMTCTACGNRLISLSGGAINQLPQASIGTATSGQPTTIPPMGQTTAGMSVSGQPTTIPPMGQTTAGMPVSGQPTTIPPMGQTTAGMPVSGQPTTIPPMGQTTAGMPVSGQPTTIPPMGQTTAGMPVSGQPTTIPPMGQTIAGMPVSGQPTTIPPMGQTIAGISVSGQPTTIPPMGQTTAGLAVAGQPVAYQSVAGQIVAGQTVAGQTIAGSTIAAQTIAGQPEMIPPMGQTQPSTMVVSGQPETIPPMGQTTAGAINPTTSGALQGTVDGNCICPLCGTTVPHERGTACYTIPCPKCQTLMVSEGAVINRTAISQYLTSLSSGVTTAGAPLTTPMGAATVPGQMNTTTTQSFPPITIPGQANTTQTMPFTTIPGQMNTTQTFSATPVAGIIDLPAMTIAGTSTGSVCIASTGSTIQAEVADIFDKAPYFLIVGLGKIKAIPNPNVTDLIGSGVQSAQLIVSEGAKVLITNDIGISAIKELTTLNVKVYTGIRGTAEQALLWYQDNRLSPTVLNASTTEEEHGPPSSSKAKAKGETSL